ncbi:phage holin [Metabacillus fastidiosus]|uniref:Phage holin n=1 Tax=Metabacillus fastidiosus TaxID=1458 RepID=A0ABU6NRI1_9BACI|nr:phage holin [Metabacillus fastidiosus]MED4399756.1 phage holin [Metabacillus fastidiosus]
MKNIDKSSIVRYTILVIAVLNAVLNLVGFQTISDQLTNDLVAVISGAVMLYAGWKNNYLSKKGLAQKEVVEKEGLN